QTTVAVVLDPRDDHHRDRPVLAGVPTPLRPRTHLPIPQTDPRLDPTQATHSRPSRPLDLAHPHHPHPATTGPSPHPRPTPTLGETNHHTRPADPRPGPPRVSPPPTEDHPPGRRTETLTPRPRPPTRLQEHPPRPTTRPRQKHQN